MLIGYIIFLIKWKILEVNRRNTRMFAKLKKAKLNPKDDDNKFCIWLIIAALYQNRIIKNTQIIFKLRNL